MTPEEAYEQARRRICEAEKPERLIRSRWTCIDSYGGSATFRDTRFREGYGDFWKKPTGRSLDRFHDMLPML
jgi:hypothetical protein